MDAKGINRSVFRLGISELFAVGYVAFEASKSAPRAELKSSRGGFSLQGF